MTKLSAVLMIAAVACFAAAMVTRAGAPKYHLFFSFGQFLDLTTVFLLGAILTTLRERRGEKTKSP